MKALVGITPCDRYDVDLLIPAIREAITLSGGTDVSGKSILLKPNILSGHDPDKAISTHPEFMRAVIRVFRELGAAEIYVGDSPGYQQPQAAARRAGILPVVEEEGAVWADFHESPPAVIPGGSLVSTFLVAPITQRVDLIVSLPKMKNHQLMFYTGAMKNMFGTIPGINKAGFHMRFPDRANFARMLVELNQAVKPGFAVMDGVVGMEGPGPGNGWPRKIGFVLASSNPLALDAAASTIMGYDPLSIPTISGGIAAGTWLSSLDEVECRGIDPKSVIIEDFVRISAPRKVDFLRKYLPGGLYDRVRGVLIPRPIFNRHRCVKCGECIAICPAKALSFAEPKKSHVRVDYSACIRCYCCHEICPADAIAIKRRL